MYVKKIPDIEYKPKTWYINSIESQRLFIFEKFKIIPPYMETIPSKENLEKLSVPALYNVHERIEKITQSYYNHWK